MDFAVAGKRRILFDHPEFRADTLGNFLLCQNYFQCGKYPISATFRQRRMEHTFSLYRLYARRYDLLILTKGRSRLLRRKRLLLLFSSALHYNSFAEKIKHIFQKNPERTDLSKTLPDRS
jgi:hypothetical protein